jgi:8-oxo-dGTP pyrophosphatase MutT (NUDIX family)
MTHFYNASFPPNGPWDPRLSTLACPELVPVETLHENPWYSVRNRGGFFTVEYRLRQVVVLPVVNQDSIAMVRVKRPVINDTPLELPAGALEKDEDAATGAARELLEETGIKVTNLDRFISMAPISVSSTRNPNLSYIFKVDISEKEYVNRQPHDDEIYSVERFAINDLAKKMASGEIYVSVTLAVLGIFLASR